MIGIITASFSDSSLDEIENMIGQLDEINKRNEKSRFDNTASEIIIDID